MECLNCKAQMKKGIVPFDIDRHGYHISWDSISAWMCDRCSEILFETKEVDLIQEILTTIDLEANSRQA